MTSKFSYIHHNKGKLECENSTHFIKFYYKFLCGVRKIFKNKEDESRKVRRFGNKSMEEANLILGVVLICTSNIMAIIS